MAVVAAERIKSRRFVEDERVELRFLVEGSEEYADILAGVLAASPATENGWSRGKVQLELMDDVTNMWEATVPYEAPGRGGGSYRAAPLPVGDTAVSCRLGGRSFRRYVSYQTVASYAVAGVTAPDYKGYINVVNGVAEGVDLPSGTAFHFQITKALAAGSITDAWLAAVAALCDQPHTNAAEFHGFAAGKVRFDGASVSRRADRSEEAVFDFAVDEGETGIALGSITGITRQPHHYLWTVSQHQTSNNRTVIQPLAAYIERVYPGGSFVPLGV